MLVQIPDEALIPLIKEAVKEQVEGIPVFASKPLVGEEEAAERLNISVSHMKTLRRDRKIAFVRLGGAIRYDVRVLDKFVDECTVEPIGA